MCAEAIRQMSLMLQSGGTEAFLHEGLSPGMRRCAIARDRLGESAEVTCESIPCRSMLTVVVYLTEYGGHSMWCDALPMALPHQVEGMMGVYDRSHRWKCTLQGPLDCVQFHFPRSRLDDQLHPAEGERSSLLDDAPARLSVCDPILKHLALASLPLLESKEGCRTQHGEQVMDAVVTHIARVYSHLRSRSTFERDRLAPWQIRKIVAYASAKIDERVTVKELASECALSSSHFSYLFKSTTGSTPHQWLLSRRIDLAKGLLRNTDESLASIASASGFSDQSHFTRVFSRRVKASPSMWRRVGRPGQFHATSADLNLPVAVND